MPGECIRKVYEKLVQTRVIVPAPEPEVPKVPMDYTWAKKLGTSHPIPSRICT